jgi:glutathione S-transferase
MLTLYHGPGSVSSQKVRLVLAEKGLDWESRPPGRSMAALRAPEYLKLNPNGVVPTLLHDDVALIESRLINEYLDETFPEPPLQPPGPLARHRMRLWTRRADDELHLNVFALMFLISRRESFIQTPRETWRANLPGLNDPVKQEWTMDLAVHGYASRHVDQALARFVKLAAELEEALAEGPWLAGERYSLADAALTPFLHRLRRLGLERLWRGRAVVEDWLSRLEARPSFEAAILRWETAEDVELMASSAEKAAAQLADRLG